MTQQTNEIDDQTNQLAELAQNYLNVSKCKECGKLYVIGFCCHFCGTGDPS